jgi:hypothetical protein
VTAEAVAAAHGSAIRSSELGRRNQSPRMWQHREHDGTPLPIEYHAEPRSPSNLVMKQSEVPLVETPQTVVRPDLAACVTVPKLDATKA